MYSLDLFSYNFINPFWTSCKIVPKFQQHSMSKMFKKVNIYQYKGQLFQKMVDIKDKSLKGFTAYACFVIRDTSVKLICLKTWKMPATYEKFQR